MLSTLPILAILAILPFLNQYTVYSLAVTANRAFYVMYVGSSILLEFLFVEADQKVFNQSIP